MGVERDIYSRAADKFYFFSAGLEQSFNNFERHAVLELEEWANFEKHIGARRYAKRNKKFS